MKLAEAIFKPGARCGHAPGFLKLFSKKCVCVCACMYVCLSFHDHVSKPLTGESSKYAKNKS